VIHKRLHVGWNLGAAFGKTDDLDRLTDAEIQARLATTGDTLMRELDLRILRTREETMALLAASARKDPS